MLAKSCQDLFHAFEQEDTLKKAMVRNLWTVHRPNVDLERFEKVTDQTWAKDLALGTHRLRQSWVEKRVDNVDEEGFPKPLREDEEVPEKDRVLPECQLDCSYHPEEPGSLLELSTWKLMTEKGEMSETALRDCSQMPWMEWEVQGMLDFEGLEEAKELLISPKTRRLEAGLDPMLTSQGLTPEKKRQKAVRRQQRMKESKQGVAEKIQDMREMEKEGYGAQQIGLKLILPQMGRRKVSVKTLNRKMSLKQKTAQNITREGAPCRSRLICPKAH